MPRSRVASLWSTPRHGTTAPRSSTAGARFSRRALLKARAIENELFVVGAGKAGERYVGHSLVADPLGRVLAEATGNGEELVTCEIDLAAVAAAREAMPVLEHRRPYLYR